MRKLGAGPLIVALVLGSCTSAGHTGSAPTDKATFCNLLLAYRASNDTLITEINSGDPTRARTAMTRLLDQVQTLQKRAPADIKADVDVTAAFVASFNSLLAKNGYDIHKIETDPKATEEFAALNSEQSNASRDQLRAYGDADCGAPPVSDTTATELGRPAPADGPGQL
jgi:hypothetical protein